MHSTKSLIVNAIDDKKLSGVLKKMALTNINGVEEVNIIKNDGTVIHITTPKSKISFESEFQSIWIL